MALFGLIHFKNWDKLGTVYTYEQVRNILKNAGVKGDISLRDQDYRDIGQKNFEQLRDGYCTFGDIKYRKKVYECEDFVYRMWDTIVQAWADKTTTEDALALAFGYMDGVNANGIGHAWVWVICNGIPLFYEGQTGRPMAKPPLSMNDAEA